MYMHMKNVKAYPMKTMYAIIWAATGGRRNVFIF